MTEVEELEAILETCRSKGWQLILEHLQETVDGLNNIQSISDEKALYRAQGKIHALTVVINYEDETRNILDEIENADPE